jgi:hypothetical protein
VSPLKLVVAGTSIITEMIPSPAAPPAPIPTPLALSFDPIAPDASGSPGIWTPVPGVPSPLLRAWPPPCTWGPPSGWIDSWAAPEIFVPASSATTTWTTDSDRSRHEFNDPHPPASPARGMPHAFGPVFRAVP